MKCKRIIIGITIGIIAAVLWSVVFINSLNSMAGIGKKAAEYLAGEENNNTPCTPGGCYDRLRSCGGKILLVGVGHERNTFIHSVEEVLNVPHRLSDKPMKLQIVMHDGSIKDSYMRKHYNADQPHISEDFVKLNQAFLDCKAVREVTFGDAECLLCDAQAVFNVVRHVIAPDPAPSPHGYKPHTDVLTSSSFLTILTGLEVLLSTPDSTASFLSKPCINLEKPCTPSTTESAT